MFSKMMIYKFKLKISRWVCTSIN